MKNPKIGRHDFFRCNLPYAIRFNGKKAQCINRNYDPIGNPIVNMNRKVVGKLSGLGCPIQKQEQGDWDGWTFIYFYNDGTNPVKNTSSPIDKIKLKNYYKKLDCLLKLKTV